MASLPLKKNYRCVPSLQPFYSGGAFAVSSDGSFIACASGESINIVDASNSSVRSTLEGDSEAVTALTLSPDDKLLFSSGHSRLIRVWDLSTFKCVRSWKGHDGPVMGMACHPSGGYLATAGADKKVIVWDVAGSFATHHFKGHQGVVSSLLFHPDPTKQILFSASHDTTVNVWDLDTKKRVATLTEHNSTVTSMALSEDGRTLLTAGRDKVVILWNLDDYSCLKTVTTYETLEAVCVIPSGTLLSSRFGSSKQRNGKKSKSPAICFITVGDRGIVRIWNSEGAVCLFEQKSSDVTITSDDDESKRGFTAALLLPSDQGLLCVTADQEFLLYSPVESPEGTFEFVLSKRLVGNNGEILDMKFLGDEEQFIAVATNTEQVRVFDVASMSCSHVLAGHTEIVMCLDTCVSSSGRTLIVTGSKDNSVRLWESESRCCLGVGVGHMGSVGAIAFSKKQRDFFVSGSSDRTLKVWSLDGISDNVEKPINLKAKAVVAAHDKDINSVAVAPNDSLVCSGSQDRTACVWRLPDLVPVIVLKGHKRGVWSVEFSPVDQCILTTSGDKTIKIWAISDGSCLKSFEGHMSSVYRASFLTRGTQFISSDADGLVKLWMVKTNECIATYDQHEDKVWALTVGKKTEMVATGSGDAAINLWYDCTASDKEEAFRREEEGVLKSQELENAVKDADYTKAIQIAFKLRRPHKLYECFHELFRKRGDEKQIEKALHDFGNEELAVLFEYVREWNTKPKFCHVAQFVFFKILNIYSPTEIIKVKGIQNLLEALTPYSQRHYSRVDRHVRNTLLLDFILHSMAVVEPDTGARELNEESLIPSDVNHENETRSMEEDRKQKQASEGLKEKAASRKRKSKKSKDGSKKKAKASSLE
ncbi:transducin beta-like protein 3 isoform X1 [Rosa chinensis]|uniref:transducin beta-like protein 3 isoform X1 n=1 Tax=Rosa chinensis TaxID=74649 RepID=UPI000D0887B0|nr:transducin beta-like protein 3 isoform X1 [Rosa chinensis]